jgi:hypothetical protein
MRAGPTCVRTGLGVFSTTVLHVVPPIAWQEQLGTGEILSLAYCGAATFPAVPSDVDDPALCLLCNYTFCPNCAARIPLSAWFMDISPLESRHAAHTGPPDRTRALQGSRG